MPAGILEAGYRLNNKISIYKVRFYKYIRHAFSYIEDRQNENVDSDLVL